MKLKELLKIANEKERVQYIVINTELAMGKGKIASQAAHASIEAYDKSNEEEKRKWKEKGMKKIVLKATEKEIVELFQKLKKEGYACSLIKDAGRTQIKPGSITAMGCGPENEQKIMKYFEELKLL